MATSQAIIGHQKIQAQLLRSFGSDNLHSTLLFTGPEGIGKKRVALELAKTILCSGTEKRLGGCGKCQSCTVFISKNHPDFIAADLYDKEHWKVEDIRKLLGEFNVKPYMQQGRVVIFDNAHALSIAASNILLKTFEEPREKNFFILISSNPSRLPITLRSRCQVWGFSPLSTNELGTIIQSVLPGAGMSDDLITAADGSVRNAQLLVESGELVSDIKEILRRLQLGDVSFFYEDCVAWAKRKEEIPTILHLTRLLAREHMLHASSPEMRALWATFLTDINTAEWAISERNLNPLLVLFQTFLRLVPHEKSGYLAARLADDTSLTDIIAL